MIDRPPPVRPPWSCRRATDAGGTSTQLCSNHQRRRDSQRSRRRFLFPATAAVIVVLAATCVRQAAADDQEQLEIIRAGYVQTITSMQSIWVRYDVEWGPYFDERFRGMRRTMEWATEGEKFHLSITANDTTSDSHYRPYWISADGVYRWTLAYLPDDSIDHAMKEGVHDGAWELRGHATPGSYLGLYFGVGNRQVRGLTLQSLLETQPLTLHGIESVTGHDCWKVEITYPGESAEHNRRCLVWFDPQAGYLPRMITLLSPYRETRSSRVVLEFGSFAAPTDGKELPFPVSMRRENSQEAGSAEVVWTLNVTNVKLSKRLPTELFRPDIPAGVQVFNLDDKRQEQLLRDKVRTQAIAKAREREQSQSSDQEDRQLATSPATQTIDASPRKSNLTVVVLILGGLLILAVSTIAAVRERK